MAKNPMQKKTTNAFLLGIVVTFLIVALIGGVFYILYILPKQKAEEERALETPAKEVYVITSAVKSGSELIVGQNVDKKKIETGISKGVSPIDNEGNPLKAKIDLESGTIITSSMIYKEEEKITDDIRLMEYNMLTLPLDTYVGDYIDVRITLPSGQDCIVISRKQIMSMNGDTIGLNLSADEILMMNSAIVEAYVIPASNIYIAKYVEPGNQKKAVVTYPVNSAVKALIEWDKNIAETAKENFKSRYSDNLRTYINQEQDKYQEEALDNIEAGMAAQIQKAKEERQKYLSGVIQ